MFKLDIFGTPQPLNVYLAQVDGTPLGLINDYINEETASLEIGVNKQYHLSFQITEAEFQPWFDRIIEGMYLFVDYIGLFKINQPTIELNGLKDVRQIDAYSVDSELEDKNCNYPVNTGKKTAESVSLEFVVQYNDGETENLLNPYTGIPYDWIVLYNTFP